jgi:hypothetical protein
MPFSFGDKVKILSGRYAGLSGTVIDPALDSDALPTPRPGYYWVRIGLNNRSIPVHASEDDIRAEAAS